MNIKPFYQQVIAAVKETQDNNTLKANDHYGLFLLNIIRANTQYEGTAIDAGEVDTEELSSNLKYAIHEFTKALAAVEKFNH